VTEWSKAGSRQSSSVSRDKYWKLAVSWAGLLLYHGYIIRMNSTSTTIFTVMNCFSIDLVGQLFFYTALSCLNVCMVRAHAQHVIRT